MGVGEHSYAGSVLSRLEVRNFRALEELDLDLAPLTALIGPNGAGKSSVLWAIDVVLGAAWPSLRSFTIPQDFPLRMTLGS
jgi:predicted ATP-dependent endonuclease of OLD family